MPHAARDLFGSGQVARLYQKGPSFGQLMAHQLFLWGPGLVPVVRVPEVNRALFLLSRSS